MGTLIYSMITSLDGYAVAAEGDLGAGAEDQEVHTYIGDLFRGVRTFLYGRRMYETMVFWETAHIDPAAPPHIVEYARDWQAADKIVYSTTLESFPAGEPASSGPSTRRRSVASRPSRTTTSPSMDLTSPLRPSGPVVDEYHLFTTTSVVGGGTRLFPDGVRLDLDLVDQRTFHTGLIHAHYRTR